MAPFGMQNLLRRLTCRPGATCAAIAETEEQLRAKLPAEYVEFLKLSNGAEGFIGKNAYVMLWGAEELASMNQSYEVQKYAPGLVIFGSDGGGEAYGFDTRHPYWPIVKMPFIGMNWAVAWSIDGTFNEFLKRLHETE